MRDHRLAEDRLQPVEVLDVAVDLRHQDVLEVLRVRDQHHALVGHVDRDDRAIALRHLHEQTHGVLGIFQQRREVEPHAALVAETMGAGLLEMGFDRSYVIFLRTRRACSPST